MIGYASRTGTKRNLDALRDAGWGLLISRNGAWRDEGFDLTVLDCGTWGDFQLGRAWDDECASDYEALLEKFGATCQWAVAPDIVAGGLPSLELSIRWSNRMLSMVPMVLIAVQDGMGLDDLRPFVGPNVGIFLGGSTKWKLDNAVAWGDFCAELGVYYHFARCNTLQRFALANDAGADSVDGSSASRYAKTLPLLEKGRRQASLLSPRARQPVPS